MKKGNRRDKYGVIFAKWIISIVLVQVVLFYLSTSVNWNEFVTNFDNIRMEYFLLSTLFAIF
ncbi:MAG TPA: hypothetical protein VJ044_08010, partial [Candidatus Hodarchaeales archaeon]|nr:hypothetical protein [Candidatus Hodarchaeales archaeon]